MFATGFLIAFSKQLWLPCRARARSTGCLWGVHRLNVLFYNAALLETLARVAESRGLTLRAPEELTSVAQFIEHLELIDELSAETEAGQRIVPLALDNNENWPLSLLAFESLMVARRAELYEAVWMGHASSDDVLRVELSAVVDELRALAARSNLEARVTWQRALEMVGNGEAAYTVIGDWGWAQQASAAQALAAMPFPGTSHAFVYTPDSFAIPRRGGTDGSGAHMWLREVVDHTPTQTAFARIKHSIPTLRDLGESELDALEDVYVADTYREFARCQSAEGECRLLLAVSGLGPAPATDPCFDEVSKLLGRAVGAMSQDDINDVAAGTERECRSPMPDDAIAAGHELVERLLLISRESFAGACR